jgi:colanic acid/amylovoran biosynthesis protein
VGVTVRKWLDADAQERYELAVSRALDKIIQQYNVDVVFIPQVTSIYNNDDDREVSRAIFMRMKHQKRTHVMDGDYTHYDVKSMYDSLDFIIGTRFHSVIFSLTSFVPAIAIEYEHKTGGIMRDLGLSQWALKIENVTEKDLTQLFAQLIKDEAKYRGTLKKVIPPYAARAADAIKQVDAAYRSLPPRS